MGDPGVCRRPQGNALDLHVDGEDALRAIAEALDGAERRVHLAGWFFSPGFRLVRDGSDERTLAERLAQIARRAEVRVLAWAGAPLPLFRPSRATVREALAGLRLDSRVQVAADARERPLHCHHEKLVIVDDELAFVGGIDLTDLAGDRFDRSGHPARADIGWHDAAAELRGPAVGDVAAHFALRWREVTGERLELAPRPGPAGSHEVQVVRTVPEKVYDALPRGEFSILEAYTGALRAAQRLVYVENQFLWSPEIVELLADKLRNPPTDGFRLVAVLPARPNNGGDDTRGALGILMEADAGRGRLLACCRLALGSGEARSVYVHAKIAIVDDEWLTIGSANLNEHSLFNDTEMNLVTRATGARSRDAPAPVGRAPRLLARRARRRPRSDRRRLAASRGRGAAAPPRGRSGADARAGAAPARVAPGAPPARPDRRAARRRLKTPNGGGPGRVGTAAARTTHGVEEAQPKLTLSCSGRVLTNDSPETWLCFLPASVWPVTTQLVLRTALA